MAIGAATGAAGAAITGGDPLQGALLGGIGGGISGGYMGGLAPGSMAANLGKSMGLAGLIPTTGLFGSGVSAAAAAGAGIMGLGGSLAMGYLMPKQQDYSQYYQGAYNPIAYNTQQSQITGSGGRQAPALLAAEIKRAKKRREGQAAQGELGLATSLSNTGLQIA
jgi:hypothetical protein